jgi:hypothetical protein
LRNNLDANRPRADPIVHILRSRRPCSSDGAPSSEVTTSAAAACCDFDALERRASRCCNRRERRSSGAVSGRPRMSCWTIRRLGNPPAIRAEKLLE